jgi:PIN domain nuclease of toxin-antitoxin system
VNTVLLDTHALYWWSAEPERVGRDAEHAILGARELAVSDITWFELAWLVEHDCIVVAIPGHSWFDQLAAQVRTVGITPAIARTAVGLPSTFPKDPADRLIYATAIVHGWSLITKDRRLRRHRHPRQVTVW